MTEQPDDLLDAPPPRGSRNDALLLAIGETRAAARQAAEASARVESAVGGLAVRVGKLEVDFARMEAALATRAEADREEKTTATSPWTVASVIAAFLAAVIATIAIIAK